MKQEQPIGVQGAEEGGAALRYEDREGDLPAEAEDGRFWRGLPAGDAYKAIFGDLRLDAHPKSDSVGPRDNATINMTEAIGQGGTSVTKDNRKFLCAINFEPLETATIEDSKLQRWTSYRVTGPISAKEVVVRFAGDEPGKPQTPMFLSPKEFYAWFRENVEG